jgi:hypothetical protein
MRWLVVGLLAVSCGKPDSPRARCVAIKVPQEDGVDRVSSCREHGMDLAFGLCESEPPLVPGDHPESPTNVKRAPGMSFDDCLRAWRVRYDTCPDEPDLQWRFVVETAKR